MNTFLPYASFEQSVKCLDSRRLGKQRIEAWQMIQILEEKTSSKAWVNHPCTRMWKGFVPALKLYYNCCLVEWQSRGFKNIKLTLFSFENCADVEMPLWLGQEQFHNSHKSNLMRKKPEHYAKHFGKDFPNNLAYIWGSASRSL